MYIIGNLDIDLDYLTNGTYNGLLDVLYLRNYLSHLLRDRWLIINPKP